MHHLLHCTYSCKLFERHRDLHRPLTVDVSLQGVKEAKERAAREELLLKQYQDQDAMRFAAAVAEKKLKAARLQATVQQVLRVASILDG